MGQDEHQGEPHACSVSMLLTSLALLTSLHQGLMIPSRLHFEFKEAMGSTLEVRVNPHGAASLVLSRSHRFAPETKRWTLRPSAEQWQVFRKRLDALGIWTWPQRCPNRLHILDGMQWSLDIAYTNHEIRAAGENCYPNNAGAPVPGSTPSPCFRGLLQALEALTGQSLTP